MTCRKAMMLFAAMALAFWNEAVQGVTWVKGGGGSSCETVCSARGGCLEEEWPMTEEEFTAIAAEAGQTCETTQHGGAKYDPSTDGRHCGWGGPDEANSEGGRCVAKGDESTYRFCPCATDKEL
mmetsp:Transcript_85698/g.135323  ORF Transcript_85698/g.135323 Transcript_85698/m.135323 type:complete len:124 (+) Transcript_85698:63-434(+)|eukprot:CAMPEP_0169124688 /NCGR_PEP_ID=MMETSP1015-20121227/34459_1 /TAXON_ID=342587 /ORGANISM="Karlodinium micrum, Strain CCMP2283" /LENGTH=123 /DNA_ID=CAMNT_0009188123 /DNA_START=57 /DNA_END=428 /DNA_ORIENTATION=+